MGQTKISQLPAETAPTTNDSVPIYDPETGLTKRVPLLTLIDLFFNNIPASAATATTLADDTQFDHVNSGLVISGDSLGSNRNASISAGTCYINGIKATVSASSARTYTASRDTYVDVLLSGSTATLVFTEVTNNAASPALASNSIRIGIVVTGASTIANAGSINQGQEDKVLPIASSIAYTTTDSLGNLICPRDPNRKLLGYRQITASVNATSQAQILGLTVPVIVPTGRKVKIRCVMPEGRNSTSPQDIQISIWDGTVGVGTRLNYNLGTVYANTGTATVSPEAVVTPTSASKTYNISASSTGGTATLGATATSPMYAIVELE